NARQGVRHADLSRRPRPVQAAHRVLEPGDRLPRERDRKEHEQHAPPKPGEQQGARPGVWQDLRPGKPRRAHGARRSATIRATFDGVRPTATPEASSASAFAAAVPLDPVTIAPAWPMRLPGGASNPAM